MSLTGKKVVIVGGSSGMGLATAAECLMEGASVIIASRSIDKLDKAKELLRSSRIQAVELDMTIEASVRSFFETQVGCGGFDHLVITASSARHGNFLEMPIEDARYTFESKFWGPFTLVKYGAPLLNNSSESSITLFSALSAVNAAIEGLARSLALELAPIRVNVVSPGMTDTPAYSALPQEMKEAMFKRVGATLPVQRVGRPDDIAKAVLFLMQNTFVTGTTIDVDGGEMVRKYQYPSSSSSQ